MGYYKHFDSLDEFCTQPFTLSENKRRCARDLCSDTSGWSSDSYGGSDWFGGTSSAQVAADRVTKGWAEGADRVMQNLADLEMPTPMRVQRRVLRSDQGDELDIHTVYRGDLAHAWTSRKRKNARGPFVLRIIAQTNMLADFSGEQMFWRGAAAVKAIDMLTSAGYSVEVLGVLASEMVAGNHNQTFAQSFPLKESGAPLDVAQLAGVICNAGFHRLFGFRAYFAATPGTHGSVGDARSDISGRVIEHLQLDVDGIPTFRVPYGIHNKKQAEEWLKQLVTTLEGERAEQHA